MHTPAQLTAVLLTAAVVGGCATRADLVKLQRDQREVRALLADTQVAVDGLRRRIEALRSEIEEANRGRGTAGRGGTRSAAELERRLAELEARLAAQAAPASATPGPGIPGAEAPADVVPPPTPEPTRPMTAADAALEREEAALQGARVDDEYREGIQQVRAAKCDQAVPKLRSFLRKNPKSDLADNAQYWIGECYYGQKDYNRAIIELNEVLLKYPKGDKVPSALLTLASSFADSGDKIDARLILQKLISDHPKSEEAERGRQKLQSLGE